MTDVLLLALLLAAVAIGWWLGRRERRTTAPASQSPTLARDYFVGLNYLLNDQQDRAIETFIGALEVNSDTIETHIALGNPVSHSRRSRPRGEGPPEPAGTPHAQRRAG